MPIPPPKLDDRRFGDLLDEAKRVIAARAPAWTDMSASDPGMILVEAFAHLTEILVYRLNRMPERVHVTLLDLLGVNALPPSAAQVLLTFTRIGAGEAHLTIPAGTRVADASGAVVFVTLETATLAPDARSIDVPAMNAERIEGELLGYTTDEPHQTLRVKRGPIVREPFEGSLEIGIETEQTSLSERTMLRRFQERTYTIWQEVDSFAGPGSRVQTYRADRYGGTIVLAPTHHGDAVASSNAAGREVRAWYWRGAGQAGNVDRDKLVVLRDAIPGVTVSNRERASGGSDAETLEQAITRGRQAVRVLSSAVTAGDFERVAHEVGGIAKARAAAQRELRAFGEPGIVEVTIVPKLPHDMPPTKDAVERHQTPELARSVADALDKRRPIGVRTRVLWADVRPVAIKARIVVSDVEDKSAITSRIAKRLDALLAPDGNWPFGTALRASNVYDLILAEPGVRYADQIEFRVEEAPEIGVEDIAAEPSDPRTFYVAATGGVYRTNDGAMSWSRVLPVTDGAPIAVRCSVDEPGLMAAIVRRSALADEASSFPIHLSTNGGDSWIEREQVQGERVWDAAWLNSGDRRPTLLVATDKGLRVFEPRGMSGSVLRERLAADRSLEQDGFFAVATARTASGRSLVALAARSTRGVLLSRAGGENGTFELLSGSQGMDVRALTFQRTGDRTFLWAGLAAEGPAKGDGAMRTEARDDGTDPAGWTKISQGWEGGSCEGLAWRGRFIVAASNRSGVLVLDSAATRPSWTASPLSSGLPTDDERRSCARVSAVAAGGDDASLLILAGGQRGTFASRTLASTFSNAGHSAHVEVVTLPRNAVFCSGAHELHVVSE